MSYTKTLTKNSIKVKPRYPVPMVKGKFVLEGQTKEQFIKLFPKHSNKRIMQWFGLSFAPLQRLKRELSLEKDMQAIKREQMRDVKRTCEKNGYYASLKGRKPSEACIEATRKMFREGFSPLRVLKAKNPRKFKRSIEKRRDKWLETRRRERARIIYGLPQKTKFHIVIQPLSHAASSQKHIMIKQNNYFSDPEHPSWVCYDSETTRSPRREATAIKHGLNIVAGE